MGELMTLKLGGKDLTHTDVLGDVPLKLIKIVLFDLVGWRECQEGMTLTKYLN